VKAFRVALFASMGALLLSPLYAGDSEMLTPPGSLNVWAGGKMSVSVYGGLFKTSTGIQDAVSYDDKDRSGGLRFAFPVSENLTLQIGGRYESGHLENDHAYAVAFYDPDDLIQVMEVDVDKEKRRDYGLNVTGLYTLAAGADSPIRGGLYFGFDAGKKKADRKLKWTENIYFGDPQDPNNLGYSSTLDNSFRFYSANEYTARVGLTADIHLIRDVLRVTPSVGYYYRFRRSYERSRIRLGSDEQSGYNLVSVNHIEGNDRGGGATYGLEVGYRPGGAEGKFEIVLSPYFKSEKRQLAPAVDKLYDHRNGIVLLVRGTF